MSKVSTFALGACPFCGEDAVTAYRYDLGANVEDDYLLDQFYSTCYAVLALNENPPD